MLKFFAHAITDVGLVRDHNEDNFLIEEDVGLFVIADGMGGHGYGEKASQAAVETLNALIMHESAILDAEDDSEATQDKTRENTAIPSMSSVDTLVEADLTEPGDEASKQAAREAELTPRYERIVAKAVRATNARVYTKNTDNGFSPGTGMGTTIVGLWHPSENVNIVFHVGDSRLYRFRAGNMERLTMDHSLYEKWKQAGSKGDPPRKNILTRAIGPFEEVIPDIFVFPPLSGDVYLLCSDGLTSMLDDEAEILNILKFTSMHNLRASCTRLVDLAKSRGGRDNITVILIFCR